MREITSWNAQTKEVERRGKFASQTGLDREGLEVKFFVWSKASLGYFINIGFTNPAGLWALPIFKLYRKLQDKHARKTDVAAERLEKSVSVNPHVK